jgi:hypothetical protein
MQPKNEPPPDSPFGKFQTFMKALVRVPKKELDAKLDKEKGQKKTLKIKQSKA